MRKYTTASISALMFCLTAIGVIGGPFDDEIITQIQRQEVIDRLTIQRELEAAIAENTNRMGATVTKYDGPAKKTRLEHKEFRRKLRDDMLTAELIEVPR